MLQKRLNGVLRPRFMSELFLPVFPGVTARSRFAAGLCLLTMVLSGCTVGPDYQPPEPEPPAQFSAVQASPALQPAAVEQRWWRNFEDPQLNRLLAAAIKHNHDLRIARANLRQARALLDAGRLELLPIVTAEGSVIEEKDSLREFGEDDREDDNSGGSDRIETFYDAGLDASWELDFFGRVRRSVEALRAEYGSLQAEQQAVFVAVAAEVARTYMELRGAQYRLQVARDNVASQKNTLDLTQTLLNEGVGTRLDLVRARAQLQSTRATIPPLQTETARAIRRLSVLTGQQPAALDARLEPAKALPEVPAVVAIGQPRELLRRRPDVRQAERQLAAATARIGVQVADLFPRVTLLGSFGATAVSFSGLGDEAAERYSFGPSISWAAFDLGRVRARIRAAEAVEEGQLALYERTVLTALEEAENGITRYSRSLERTRLLRDEVQASEEAAELARLRFRDGVDNFLTVLDAERSLLDAQDRLAVSELETLRALVALYNALGGGWQGAFENEQT